MSYVPRIPWNLCVDATCGPSWLYHNADTPMAGRPGFEPGFTALEAVRMRVSSSTRKCLMEPYTRPFGGRKTGRGERIPSPTQLRNDVNRSPSYTSFIRYRYSTSQRVENWAARPLIFLM
jgi:hypothetical protein